MLQFWAACWFVVALLIIIRSRGIYVIRNWQFLFFQKKFIRTRTFELKMSGTTTTLRVHANFSGVEDFKLHEDSELESEQEKWKYFCWIAKGARKREKGRERDDGRRKNRGASLMKLKDLNLIKLNECERQKNASQYFVPFIRRILYTSPFGSLSTLHIFGGKYFKSLNINGREQTISIMWSFVWHSVDLIQFSAFRSILSISLSLSHSLSVTLPICLFLSFSFTYSP